jgi:predicted transcriptional regulator
MLDRSRSTCGFLAEARTHQHSLQWAIELRSIEHKIMTSQLESLIQQATQLDRDERIELITHLANSLHSSNDPISETVLTDIQQSQLARLRSEIEVGLEQVKAGKTVDGETVFANLRARVNGYRETK